MRKDFVVGLFILFPLFVLSFFVYNPHERALKKVDSENKEKINLIARALEPYYKKEGVYPEKLSPEVFLSYTPEGYEKYNYSVSENGKDAVVYTEAMSLSLREYCHKGASQILYSSFDNRTDIVCEVSLASGKQRFER